MADLDEKEIEKFHQQKKQVFTPRNLNQWKKGEQKLSQGNEKRPRCKKPGHIAKDCPTVQGKVQGRVYAMTQEQADADASIVTDSGSTHSFASCAFVRKLGITPDLLKVRYSVTVPSGEEMDSNQMLRACSIQISYLGMDWLTKYHATIDCNKKIVIFQPPGEEQFVFNGTFILTVLTNYIYLKAQKMLNKGCVGYLASVLDTQLKHN
ncbi:hypothetical protein Pfo_030073 [Paulownia fortunei]|nr:hypothetical protein Pfo_030073 [Paulownia fortunei]